MTEALLKTHLPQFDADDFVRITYVIDDDDLVTRSISGLLENENIHAVGYPSGELFLKEFRNDPRDCIICDYKMPEMNGLQVHRKLIEMGSLTPIIFLSGNVDKDMTMAAWNEGAVTVIEKPFYASELLKAVSKAQKFGEDAWKQIQAKKYFQNMKPEDLAVLKYLVKGLINKQIASRLNISERTVERRKSSILDTTNCSSIIAAADLARVAGIDLDVP